MRRQDYTVGWICAVETEYVVACELLDEEDDELSDQPPQDDNAYTFGRVGEHHVVIACLPKGRYGIASAASVAKDMLRSFESIRLGLMVGIGGGAPSDQHDIRLGDIVVGCPTHERGGVIPYDFGKAIQDQEFKPAGILNSPPTILLNYLNKLSTIHKRKGSHIAESIGMMITRNPRLRKDCQHPGAENDKLYESSYIHRGVGLKCEGCCDSTWPPLLQRPLREVDPDEPVVHYGLVASADRLMKDAIARDRLIKECDVLCFEMEAAGLMNNFPCVVIRGICDYSDSHKNDAWQGYAAAAAASYAKELLSIIPKSQIASTQTATAEMFEPLFSVPFEKDVNFVDRKDIFAQIEEQLHNHHRASLCGLGGVGKSQIVIEYSYRFRQSQPQSHVFWVSAASSSAFLQACQGIARSLKLPAYDDPETDPCDLVSKWLKEDHSWLMVLDNADDAKLFFPSNGSDASPSIILQTQRSLEDYLPRVLSSQKSLLVTTRNRPLGEDLAHGELCVETPPFSSQEAKELLQSKLKGAGGSLDVSNTERLLDILGYIPLAITQAAALIKRNRWTVQGYLTAIEKDNQNFVKLLSKELQDPRRSGNSPSSVFRTWKLSFDQILAQEPRTARMLSLIAMLDPPRIPEKLMRFSYEEEVDFRMAVGTLIGFALISQEIGGESYAIHPLVRASVHYWLEQRNEKADYTGQALQLLAEEFPDGVYKHKETCELMLAHAKAVLCYDCVSEENWQHRAILLYKVAWFDWQQGRCVSANREVSEAYKIYRERLGEAATTTLSSLALLALVLSDQGKYEAAEEMIRRVLDEEGKVLGVEHPSTLTSASNLAIVLQVQGKYKAAQEMNLRALDGQKKILGVEHPSTLTTVHTLASLLQHQGKYEAAEEMNRRALEGREKVLGVKHPSTLTSVSNLALVLQDQGKYKAAEAMYRRALEGREKVLGVKHPSTFTSVYRLAYLFHIQKRYNNASVLYIRASEGFLQTLGADHPETRDCSQNYASMIQQMES